MDDLVEGVVGKVGQRPDQVVGHVVDEGQQRLGQHGLDAAKDSLKLKE